MTQPHNFSRLTFLMSSFPAFSRWAFTLLFPRHSRVLWCHFVPDCTFSFSNELSNWKKNNYMTRWKTKKPTNSSSSLSAMCAHIFIDSKFLLSFKNLLFDIFQLLDLHFYGVHLCTYYELYRCSFYLGDENYVILP